MMGLTKPLLLIDNFDSFAYILIHYLEVQGCQVHVVRNDVSANSIDFNTYQGVVISPGPGSPSTSGNLISIIDKIPQEQPILGICLGMQAMGERAGFVLQHGSKPFHGKQTGITHKGHPMFKDVPINFSAGRYHSLVIKQSEDCNYMMTAISAEGELMAIAHRSIPRWGIQFHPESCMTEYGVQMIKNWIDFINDFVPQLTA